MTFECKLLLRVTMNLRRTIHVCSTLACRPCETPSPKFDTCNAVPSEHCASMKQLATDNMRCEDLPMSVENLEASKKEDDSATRQ